MQPDPGANLPPGHLSSRPSTPDDGQNGSSGGKTVGAPALPMQGVWTYLDKTALAWLKLIETRAKF